MIESDSYVNTISYKTTSFANMYNRRLDALYPNTYRNYPLWTYAPIHNHKDSHPPVWAEIGIEIKCKFPATANKSICKKSMSSAIHIIPTTTPPGTYVSSLSHHALVLSFVSQVFIIRVLLD